MESQEQAHNQSEQLDEAKDQPKRSSLTLQERLDVIDFLRSQHEPITAATKVEAAAIISEATGVQISAAQIDYLIDQTPKADLGRKIAIGSGVDWQRAHAELQGLVRQQSELINALTIRLTKLEDMSERR